MEECLIVHPRAYNKACILFILAFLANFVSLILMTINYCRSTYSLDYLEENDPDIDLTGIKYFSFSSGNSKEYSPSLPNLGNTGSLFLNCYTGKCTYVEEYICGDNDYRDVCEKYEIEAEHSCSNYCRLTKSSSCDSSYCGGYKSYSYESSKCSNDDDSEDYDKPKSCNADNIIYSWNKFYYDSTNATAYGLHTYLNSAVQANETCPSGKKMCGVLDDLGNKLCYKENEDCPINDITLTKVDSYESTTIGDMTLYYTNKATETGRVLGGFFVDSDLLIKFNNNDCKILATDTISSLLNSQNNILYRNSLDFDPYKEKNIDQRGKSYLKWCIPGYGKEKNITLIKELKVVYEYNITTNKEVIKPIKTLFKASYFIALPGYIGSFLFLLILICSFCSQNYVNSSCELGFLQCSEKKNLFIFIPLLISLFLILIGAIISITTNYYLSKEYRLEIEKNLYSSLSKINIVCFSINMFLIVSTIGLLLFLYYTHPVKVDDTLYNSYLKKNNDKTTKDKDLNVYNSNQDSNTYNNNNTDSNENNSNQPLVNGYSSQN